jgi:hypothetical protein
MAGSDMMTNAGVASLAYNDALTQARTAQNSLFRGFGFVSADAGGNYTTEAAQSAFDPRTLFRDAAPTENQLTGMAQNLHIGGTGKIADTMRAGGTAQADITEAAQHSGFGGASGVTSGITQQQRDLAATQTSQNVMADKLKFLTGEASALGGIGSAQMQLQQTTAADAAQANINKAIIAALTQRRNRGRGNNG